MAIFAVARRKIWRIKVGLFFEKRKKKFRPYPGPVLLAAEGPQQGHDHQEQEQHQLHHDQVCGVNKG